MTDHCKVAIGGMGLSDLTAGARLLELGWMELLSAPMDSACEKAFTI